MNKYAGAFIHAGNARYDPGGRSAQCRQAQEKEDTGKEHTKTEGQESSERFCNHMAHQSTQMAAVINPYQCKQKI